MTKKDELVALISEDIVKLKYLPEEKLSEEKLSKIYGVSRAPIHDAIIELSKRGLINIVPHSGSYVSKINSKRLKDIYRIRYLLEVEACKEGFEKITKNNMTELDKVFKLLKKSNKSEDIFRADNLLHQTFYEASGNDLIKEIISVYDYELNRMRNSNILSKERKKSSKEEIIKIYNALKNKNKKETLNALKEHLRNIENY